MITLSKNLKYLRKREKYSQEQLSESLNVKRSTYRDYENGTTEPNFDFLITLSEHFKVSLDDLLKGDIEKKDKEIIKNKNKSSLKNPDFRILTITVDPDDKENIEFVSNKAKAGYLTGYAHPEYLRNLQHISLPNINHGTYRAFEISGDSMPPIHEGALVIGQYIENWKYISNNKTYILVTENDGVVYKRVINKVKDKGKLLLMSDNPVYEPYYLPVEEIKEAWSYYAHLSFSDDMPTLSMDSLMKRMNYLEDEVKGLSKLLKKHV